MWKIQVDPHLTHQQVERTSLIRLSSMMTSFIVFRSFCDSIEQASPILKSETKHISTLGLRFQWFSFNLVASSLGISRGSKIYKVLLGNEITTKL